jgi:hypothetical protein
MAKNHSHEPRTLNPSKEKNATAETSETQVPGFPGRLTFLLLRYIFCDRVKGFDSQDRSAEH